MSNSLSTDTKKIFKLWGSNTGFTVIPDFEERLLGYVLITSAEDVPSRDLGKLKFLAENMVEVLLLSQSQIYILPVAIRL